VTKPYALVVLWAVFAAAAVGVGFAAAGLVSAPFAQQFAGPGVPVGPATGAPVADSGSPSPSGSPTSTAAPGGGAAPEGSTSATSRAGSASSSGSGHDSAPARPVTSQPRGITTRGGWVQGRCSGGLVTLSASPAVGWWLHDRSTGANSTGTVRFEQSGGTGEVRVSATCVAGTPRFSVTEEESGGGGGGDDGGGHGGSDDGSGSGGSGSSSGGSGGGSGSGKG
jgi:hypothetical protein